jgi:hypothetical protein
MPSNQSFQSNDRAEQLTRVDRARRDGVMGRTKLTARATGARPRVAKVR